MVSIGLMIKRRSHMKTLIGFFTVLTIGAPTLLMAEGPQRSPSDYTSEFRIKDCQFASTGSNPFFDLTPGRKTTFKGEEQNEKLDLTITVLEETESIELPDIGTIETRVIEERELVDGELKEVSRNFFAVCEKTNDVYYFGEEVQIFEEDGTTSNEGAWRAGVDEAKPGIIMPGTFILGARYFQEQAQGVALDRAEHTEEGLSVKTEAGEFENCVKISETTELEPGQTSEKTYCPEAGLVKDGPLELIQIETPSI
jgi:hypothetical protein